MRIESKRELKHKEIRTATMFIKRKIMDEEIKLSKILGGVIIYCDGRSTCEMKTFQKGDFKVFYQ